MEEVTPGKSSAPIVAIVVIILIVAIGAWFRFSGSSATPSASPTNDMSVMPTASVVPSSSTSPSGSPVVTATSVSGQVKSFTVTGQNFSFDPSTITVKKGDTVKITFKNVSGTHDFRVEGYNVNTPIIKGGASADITFVADKAGKFFYYCSVGNHRAMGMQGTLIVQ